MLNLRPILLILGVFLTVLAIAMIIPAIVDYHVGNPEWKSFAGSAFLTAFIGLSLYFSTRGKEASLNTKQAFILTSATWIVLNSFAALPFMFSNLDLSFTDAFFECISGTTTTGATVIVDLDYLPPGILLWRSILHWLGGIGIIVMAIAVFPMLRIGGMQLFRTESSDKSDKILPRAAQVSGAISVVYISLTIVCCALLWGAGMNFFDAINHAMSTISTGGFSTHDTSIGFFDSYLIETIIAIFMILSAMPFTLYIQIVRGHHTAMWNDSQVRWFVGIFVLSVIAITYWLHFELGLGLIESFRLSTFNVASIISTTGFVSSDYSAWGSFAITFLFLLSVVGGCTGSTSGGIKVFRYHVLYQTAKSQVNHLIHPNAVFLPRFNGKPVSDAITSSVMSFIILFAFSFLVSSILLSFTGLDFLTSMSASASSLANVGPGLGNIVGPCCTYTTLSDFAKWVLAFDMLIGRLELFTILVLFSAYFWKD